MVSCYPLDWKGAFASSAHTAVGYRYYRGWDVARGWLHRKDEQRNLLATIVFESVEIRDDRVVCVVKEDFVPFFAVFGQLDAPAGETGRQVEPGSL